MTGKIFENRYAPVKSCLNCEQNLKDIEKTVQKILAN